MECIWLKIAIQNVFYELLYMLFHATSLTTDTIRTFSHRPRQSRPDSLCHLHNPFLQYYGECTLKLVDDPVLVNNDRVLLENNIFNLNHTAKSSDTHKFLVAVEDNFGSTPWEQTFEFNGKSDSDDNDGVTIQPINPGTLTPISR